MIRDKRVMKLKERHFNALGMPFQTEILLSLDGGLGSVSAMGHFINPRDLRTAADTLRSNCPDLVSYSLLAVIKSEAEKLYTTEADGLRLTISYTTKSGTASATVEVLQKSI